MIIILINFCTEGFIFLNEAGRFLTSVYIVLSEFSKLTALVITKKFIY